MDLRPRQQVRVPWRRTNAIVCDNLKAGLTRRTVTDGREPSLSEYKQQRYASSITSPRRIIPSTKTAP
jgi:hypothetical protein